ncbi:SDR family NAD(P)-dependent oxidoreductase [Pseudarthrobacter sp. SSS035]|uniref:SDR family NAD(P)-dependent oxidoreductase n=1 Tax=Pseudarthrobacter sp. SSS035 TaxID=2931399 RepID=UPI00200C894A|nr:SDR family NAD(P)-dependent oxidoreductase [Pseudarthrobacter sp. SSS035]
MTAPDGPRTVMVAGSTSEAGTAVVSALSGAGFRVAAVDLDTERVQNLAQSCPNVTGYTCNLAEPAAVRELASSVRRDLGPLDGLIHLVGGWRGGDGIPGQEDSDWDFLHTSVLTTLRNTSRAFYDDLEKSPAGRLAIVSAQAAANPSAGGAAYAAIKAASEAWTLAVADGFRSSQSGSTNHAQPQRSAAVVFVVKALVDDKMKASQPDRKFPGFTHVKDLGAASAALFSRSAAELNGSRLPLA